MINKVCYYTATLVSIHIQINYLCNITQIYNNYNNTKIQQCKGVVINCLCKMILKSDKIFNYISISIS